jgi:hypothetical protein
MKDHLFFADAYVSRKKYPSAKVLEDYLFELNNNKVSRYSKQVLAKFNIAVKQIRQSILPEYQAYYGRFVLDYYTKSINGTKANIPDKCKSLLRNVIKTKFKIEILGIDKS